MNLEEILSKKSNEVTKEEMAFVFENLDWGKLASTYAENVGDIDFEIPAEELKNYIRVDEPKTDSE
jgi:hypothetical protein